MITGVVNYLSSWGGYLYKQASAVLGFDAGSSSKRASAASITALHEDTDKPREKCGVFAYFSKGYDRNLGDKLYKGLIGIQHRGQQGCGMAYRDAGREIKYIKDSIKLDNDGEIIDRDAGLVNNVFDQHKINMASGSFGIAHTLYTTAGAGTHIQAHPFVVGDGEKKIALVHNGNLSDLRPLKDFLSQHGISAENKSDSAMMADAIHWYAKNEDLALKGAVEKASKLFIGTYNLLVMNKEKIVIARDPYGNRPLCIGKVTSNHGTDFVVASESSVLKPLKAEYIRDVAPGELLVLSNDITEEEVRKVPENLGEESLCALEHIYLMKPNSMIRGRSASEIRRDLGKRAAIEFKRNHPEVEADYIIPIPEGGVPAATGFAEQLGKPVNPALIKNFHRRTFIDNGSGVDDKFAAVEDAIKDKVIVAVDDSVVRGKSSKATMQLIKEAKPKALHLVSASPMVRYPNYYGVNIPTQKELIANKHNGDTEKMAKELEVDSMTFLSQEGYNQVVGEGRSENSIFDNQYRIPVDMAA